MKIITSVLLALLLATGLTAQDGCEILVRLENYPYDTIWFGTTFGKREVPDFAAVKQADGSFLLKTEKPLNQGMYAIIHQRASNAPKLSFPIWLVDGQRKFSVTTNPQIPFEKPNIVGSPENELLFRYQRQFRTADAALDEAIDRWRYLQDEGSWQQRVKYEEEFRKFQDDFIKGATPGLTTHLIGQTLLPLPAKGTKEANWQQEAEARWSYQRAHYFDKMDIATPDFLRYPQWLDRVDFFLFHLPPPHPDTTKAICDLLFKQLEAYPDGYNYYQKYVINSLAKMSQYRLDEVYVYIVQHYLSTDKGTWATPTEVKNAINTTYQMIPLFEGEPAPRTTLFDRENKPVPLYDIQANLTLVLFYMPDCGHCKLEIPIIAKLYEQYKQKGLKVAAVCLKTLEDTPKCWEFTDSQNLPKDWYLLADPNRTANLTPLFNVKSFPRLFLLDADKKILYKRSGESPEWQLDALLKRYLK